VGAVARLEPSDDVGPVLEEVEASTGVLLRAWSPYILLVIFVLLWGAAPVKALLDKATLVFAWPVSTAKSNGCHRSFQGSALRREIHPESAVGLRQSATVRLHRHGTAVAYSLGRFSGRYRHAARDLSLSILTMGCVLALAYLMNYSGCTATLGLAFAATGMFFPFFSAPLGWLGVFLTGSDTSANALFGNLQVVTANKLGLSPALMASANSAGGVMAR